MPADFHEQPEGAYILHKLQPNLHKSPQVESSVRLAEKKGEKSGNGAVRLGRLLARLDSLQSASFDVANADELGLWDEDDTDDGNHLKNKAIDSRIEAKVFERLVERYEDSLLIDEADIPQAYWTQQEELSRDNGNVSELDEDDRRRLAVQLRGAQGTGIRSWTEYLKRGPYPMWFNVFALEGMGTLATFNKVKGYYNKRSKGTVAPYPQLNPSALAKVYDTIVDADERVAQEQDERKLPLAGNFNKLYSYFLLQGGNIVATPEKPEDVHGQWREFTEENIDDLVEAAQSTPWCIAGHAMAEEYLQRDESKFYLFFLKDEVSDEFSQTASASIRMEDGEVREISGLKGESKQYLEDALVPTVMEKVKDLPGGEHYLLAFKDKQRLIAMDRKFQTGKDFTPEEIRFLYEADRPIYYVDTYVNDPRPKQFKSALLHHREILESAEGPDARLVFTNVLAPSEVRMAIDSGISASAAVDSLYKNYMNPARDEYGDIIFKAEIFDVDDDETVRRVLAAGADVDKVMEMSTSFVVGRLAKEFMAAGIDPEDVAKIAIRAGEFEDRIDDYLADGLDGDWAYENYYGHNRTDVVTALARHGASLSKTENQRHVLDGMTSDDIEYHEDDLRMIGITDDQLADYWKSHPRPVDDYSEYADFDPDDYRNQ